ncbi:hypothetical protein Pint_22321 [Pistacia integerrima]
MMRW